MWFHICDGVRGGRIVGIEQQQAHELSWSVDEEARLAAHGWRAEGGPMDTEARVAPMDEEARGGEGHG